MTHITHLRTYSDMRDALLAIDALYASYLKTHKRKASIALTVASLIRPFDRSKRRVFAAPEPVEIRMRYVDEQAKEAAWFVEAAKEI